MWLGLQTVSSLEACLLFRVSFVERFHCMSVLSMSHFHIPVIDCGDPGFLRNGNRNLSANTFGSSVEYTCRPGYRLVGSRLRTCGANGRWSSSLPSCDPVDCGDPGSVQMGVRELLEGTTFRSTTIFKCNRGYRLEGSATRTCQANGSWSGSLPRCVGELWCYTLSLHSV